MCEDGVVGKGLTIGGDYHFELCGPVGIVEPGSEAAFDDMDHDRYRGGGTGACAEHRDEAVIGGADEFGTELQDAAVERVFFDDLYPLAGYLHAPVLFFYAGIEFAEGGEAIVGRLEDLPDEVFFKREIIAADGE